MYFFYSCSLLCLRVLFLLAFSFNRAEPTSQVFFYNRDRYRSQIVVLFEFDIDSSTSSLVRDNHYGLSNTKLALKSIGMDDKLIYFASRSIACFLFHPKILLCALGVFHRLYCADNF